MQAQVSEQLSSLLQLDLQDLKNLKQQLDSEREALKTRDHKSIQAIAQAKSALVASIESRAKTKYKLLNTAGIDLRTEKMQDRFAEEGNRNLSILWAAVTKITKECKEANSVNGQVIQRNLQRTSRIMSIVRGQQNQQGLYGAQGRESGLGSSHRIAKA